MRLASTCWFKLLLFFLKVEENSKSQHQKVTRRPIDLSTIPVFLSDYQKEQFFSRIQPLSDDPEGPHVCNECNMEIENLRVSNREILQLQDWAIIEHEIFIQLKSMSHFRWVAATSLVTRASFACAVPYARRAPSSSRICATISCSSGSLINSCDK